MLADAMEARAAMPQANAFNIPDLMRFPLRSWDACAITSAIIPSSIPHIRAIDIPPGEELPVAEAILTAGLTEVLIIRGDLPRDMSRSVHPNTSVEVIRRFKRHYPSLRVYAAFDPYRHGLRQELTGVGRKVDAGADGFFTQPMFDLRLLEICAEMLRGHCVFWGIAPVLTERSRSFWERANNVVFPDGFAPSLEWNRAFAATAIESIRELGANVYFMPIKVNLTSYLEGLVADGAGVAGPVRREEPATGGQPHARGRSARNV
ncbi:methylenetetrahydrofolate reductase [Inquilinus limosus]|uniref:methylenetetrahydrofolate reductase n=1 Tax=Inquilinus limosus TaxID=171674 RepID=UPI003F5CF2A2